MYIVKCPKCGEKFIYSTGSPFPHCNTALNTRKIKWKLTSICVSMLKKTKFMRESKSIFSVVGHLRQRSS